MQAITAAREPVNSGPSSGHDNFRRTGDRYRSGRDIRALQFRAGGGKHDSGGKPGEMALPGNSISGWEQAFQHAAINEDAGSGEKQCAELALKNRERTQVTEEAKNERARPDMASTPSHQPNKSA